MERTDKDWDGLIVFSYSNVNGVVQATLIHEGEGKRSCR